MNLTYELVVSYLLAQVPALQPEYDRLAKQEGEAPSPYLVFGDVLAPYLRRLLTADDSESLTHLFGAVEELARSEDPKVRNLVAIEILEPLVGPKAGGPGRRAVPFFGAATTVLANEINSHMTELDRRYSSLPLLTKIRWILKIGSPPRPRP